MVRWVSVIAAGNSAANCDAWSTDMSVTSVMLRPASLTASASGFRRLP